ncbi:MAG: HAD family hydrolase [Anaerolineae bacterium]
MACRAIIFDKDGTLVDPTGLQSRLTRMQVLRAAARAALGPLQGSGSDLSSRKACTRAEGDVRVEPQGPGQANESRPCEAEQILAEDGDGDEWFPGPCLMPGVEDLLATCQSLGLGLAVATGDRRWRAEATLQALGVDGLFSSIVGIDDVAVGKPAPDMIHVACERLGCSPGEVIVVGDSPADLMMGRAAGVAACIGVSGGYPGSERLGALADTVLPTAAALQDLLVNHK